MKLDALGFGGKFPCERCCAAKAGTPNDIDTALTKNEHMCLEGR